MHINTTVVYYTSNQEDEKFEAKLRENLLKAIGGLPLISVSQKPINFGKNICVGNVGVSNQNAHRQLQIGAIAAATPFIHFAEADTLYPKEYFEYLPPVPDRIYRAPIYLLYLNRKTWRKDRFYLKNSSEASTVVGRKYIIDLINTELKDRGMWNPIKETRNTGPKMVTSLEMFSIFNLNIPIISFKTGRSMHQTHVCRARPAKILPYWGTPEEVINKFI
jgi:hypothetical protein